MSKKNKNWIEESRKEAEEVFKPQLYYDEEDDVLSITWLPKLKVDYSIETKSGFIFDVSKKPNPEIKGIEIFDFMKKIKIKKGKGK